MIRTILAFLTKVLGKDHPTIIRMTKNLADQSDKKVTSIPTKTKIPDVATKDLGGLERGSKEQIDEIIKQFGDLSELGEKGVSKLPIELQGNAFRNAKRLERKLLQDRQGIMGTDTAKIFDMDTGREVGEKGIRSLLRERGRKTRPGEEGIIGMAEDIKDQARMMKQDLKPTSMKDFLFGSQPRDRLIIDKLGPEAKKMLQEKTPDYFTMGDDYYQANNARIIRQAYNNYPPDKADKVVGYYNKLSEADKARRAAVDTAKAPESIMLPATRAILKKFSDEGKIKLSPDTLRSFKGQGGANTIDQFEKIFGFENLEVLDDYVANVAMGKARTAEELAENFIKDYSSRINPSLRKRTDGILTPRVTDRQVLTDREKARFLTGTGEDGKPLTPEALDYLKRNIEPNDPFITKYIMQYSLPRVRGDKASNYIKNLPEGYDPPDEVRAVLDLKPRLDPGDPELFADGGRVGMAIGGKILKKIFSFAKERKRLKNLIEKLQTPMLRNDRIDDLKILNFVEDVGGDKAMYDKLRMKKYENLPPKSAYRSDPIEAEETAERMMSKTRKEIDMLVDPDKTVGRKDNASGGLAYMMGE